MTTIAYRQGIMASDSRATLGAIIMGEDFSKIYKNEHGMIFGGTGGLVTIQNFYRDVRNIKSIKELESFLENKKFKTWFSVLVYFENKLYVREDDGILELENIEYYSIGSGKSYAMGALAAGSTAAEAIRIAAMFDTKTNTNIKKVYVEKNNNVEKITAGET